MCIRDSHSTQKQKKVVHAQKSEKFLETIKERAGDLGMKVNEKKTQLLCISTAIESEVSSYIRLAEEEKIDSSGSLKILGFYFGTKPDVSEHVKNLIRKYRTRSWSMVNLKKAGLSKDNLLALYKILVRPVLDYAFVNARTSRRPGKIAKKDLETNFWFQAPLPPND